MRFDGSLYERARAALHAATAPKPAPAAEPATVPVTMSGLTPVEQSIVVASALCRRFEGFGAYPYLCTSGVPSIGYGATYYMDGHAVTLRDAPIGREAAERLLQFHLRRVYLPHVLRLCPGLLGTTPEAVAGVLDWTFNLGQGNLAASTMRRRINEQDWPLAAEEMKRWVRSAGVIQRGLVLRREADAAALLTAA